MAAVAEGETGLEGAMVRRPALRDLARLPLQAVVEARGSLFPFLPVLLGLGIGIWFALPFEPGLAYYGGATLVLLAALAFWRAVPELAHPPVLILGCLAAGFLACGLRLWSVEAPVLVVEYRGPVMGRVVGMDRSQSDALRLTLDMVVLEGFSPERTPGRVRISLQDQEAAVTPGQMIMTTAFLGAPGGPTEPGAFDFQRMAFFDGLGAVGYTRDPVVIWAEAEGGTRAIDRLRSHLAQAIRDGIGGDAGAFAAGSMTGDRSGIRKDTVEALRDSNLAHLLAISGMNMAFLTGFVFALLRYGLALIPPFALRVNLKKLAAVVAFGVAAFYLALSGANVATERAFLMVSVMLGAVLIDRRALSLRTVALSALVLLLWRPEEMLEPGFQLSYAATVVLIAGFGAIERRFPPHLMPRGLWWPLMLILTSVLAGAATAPFAAAHFNRFTDYGLLANVLTGPVMSVVMGAGAVAALLAPFGLAAPALWVMGMASEWILIVAHWVAGFEGAVTPIVAPGFWPLPLITLAGLWALIWPGRARWAAVAPALLGLALWAGVDRPLLLISDDGRLIGLMGAEGRALSQSRGAGFFAETWAENDGDLAPQAEAARRPGFDGPRGARRFAVGGLRAVSLSGKGAEAALSEACATHDLVIFAGIPDAGQPARCTMLDARALSETGALAGYLEDGMLVLYPARDSARAWRGFLPVKDPIRIAARQGAGP